ncbi:MAG: rhomboid family intramembrane serine protease [Acidobacteria bacterium]|nr:rhomboid family intramembrane serine protease [Acidobacteriota bacterium]NIM60374.1 rhomboid family intramembrane serine protease [Acidobacteriota bacterium]NIO60309.1 rhomboid family intramembrane serine protease [Acidobacteriota bacterium]NIQ31364.1 rhomboid family intramembrane serine protease [Acidobacteriota bacterium]NIQ86587.1 rhomboid family intramembrane serine protease [Acidobacteriota bacterium]
MDVSRDGVVVFRSRSRARCQEMWAVLDAAGIPGVIVHRQGQCLLAVDQGDSRQAARELDDYRREGPLEQPEPALTTRGGGRTGVFVYAAVLIAVAGLSNRHALDSDWFEAGRAQAGLLMSGQWWRAFTALTLHVDVQHLMGNLVFGSVLGFLAAQRLGGGVAWLAILIGGALGNTASAWLHDSSHSAVGASTAVFAALGLLVALAVSHWREHAGSAARRWSPLIAGVLLLGWTGVGGERTDVLAHVTGAVCGMVTGILWDRIPGAQLDRRSMQAGSALLAVVVLVLAWAAAHGAP